MSPSKLLVRPLDVNDKASNCPETTNLTLKRRCKNPVSVFSFIFVSHTRSKDIIFFLIFEVDTLDTLIERTARNAQNCSPCILLLIYFQNEAPICAWTRRTKTKHYDGRDKRYQYLFLALCYIMAFCFLVDFACSGKYCSNYWNMFYRVVFIRINWMSVLHTKRNINCMIGLSWTERGFTPVIRAIVPFHLSV